jgi:class 3 adenylate cyclase
MHPVMNKFFLLVLRVLSIVAVVVMMFGFAGLLLPMFDDLSKFRWIVRLVMFNTWLESMVESYVPTVVRGWRLTDVLIILAGYLMKRLADYGAGKELAKIYHTGRMAVERRPPAAGPDRPSHGLGGGILRFLRHCLGFRRSRLGRLQLRITRLQAELDTYGRELVFLSMDVVDSAKMKKNQDHSSIAVYFKRYKEFIHRILKEHEILKVSWTPDGVMACFESFTAAFAAARKVILDLDAFNREQRRFGQAFRVRCGINGGVVLFHDDMDMDEIASHTVDIAAHAQKAAPENSIYVTRHTINPKDLITKLAPTREHIDGFEVFMWSAPLEFGADSARTSA